jgi:hypothetical protein
MLYRGPSPIFDVPEFPTLRRVKPLPKRRRTGADVVPDYAALNLSAAGGIDLINHPLMPPHDATAEELLAHAEALSAQMALQAYYMPGLGGVQELLRSGLEGNRSPAVNLGNIYGNGHGDNGEGERDSRGRGQEDEDGDYMDHLLQPGNTKKRKVPANVSGSIHGQEASAGNSGGEEEPTERSVPAGRPEQVDAEVFQTSPSPGPPTQRRGKVTPATRAGLQHKEMLKSRKRQLAAVLGALSLGDTLALDQALSAHYPFLAGVAFGDLSSPPRIRLSRRRGPRLARAMARSRQPRHPDEVPLPTSEFSFVFPSSTADRLIATKREVDILRSRFEAELARQAAKAVKLAAASHLLSLPAKGNRTKRSDRAQQRARTIGTTGEKGVEQSAEFSDQSLLGAKSQGKKKKRSALANASNPHHLRNYVPSRLPSSRIDISQINVNAQNYLGPPPLRFLSAEIPPRRRNKAQPLPQITNPADEWICPFCEYDLFFGDEQKYRRAVRLRKKVLRRRRRARERAAAAASGSSAAKPSEKSTSTYDEYDATFEPFATGESGSTSKQPKWRNDPIKDRDRGGEGISYG